MFGTFLVDGADTLAVKKVFYYFYNYCWQMVVTHVWLIKYKM